MIQNKLKKNVYRNNCLYISLLTRFHPYTLQFCILLVFVSELMSSSLDIKELK
jgi:hypothetical protein